VQSESCAGIPPAAAPAITADWEAGAAREPEVGAWRPARLRVNALGQARDRASVARPRGSVDKPGAPIARGPALLALYAVLAAAVAALVFRGLTRPPLAWDALMRDLVNYLVYMGEPARERRVQVGIVVLFFLSGLFVLTWLLKREYWKDVH